MLLLLVEHVILKAAWMYLHSLPLMLFYNIAISILICNCASYHGQTLLSTVRRSRGFSFLGCLEPVMSLNNGQQLLSLAICLLCLIWIVMDTVLVILVEGCLTNNTIRTFKPLLPPQWSIQSLLMEQHSVVGYWAELYCHSAAWADWKRIMAQLHNVNVCMRVCLQTHPVCISAHLLAYVLILKMYCTHAFNSLSAELSVCRNM